MPHESHTKPSLPIPSSGVKFLGLEWSNSGLTLDLRLHLPTERETRLLSCAFAEQLEVDLRFATPMETQPRTRSIRIEREDLSADQAAWRVELDFAAFGSIRLRCRDIELSIPSESNIGAYRLGQHVAKSMDKKAGPWWGAKLLTAILPLGGDSATVQSTLALAFGDPAGWADAEMLAQALELDERETRDGTHEVQRRTTRLARYVAMTCHHAAKPKRSIMASDPITWIPRITHGILEDFQAPKAMRRRVAALFEEAAG